MQIDTFLLKNTDKLGFLELSTSFFSKTEFEETQTQVMVPLFVEDIKATVTEKKGISILQVIRSMIYMMGVDEKFRFNSLYKSIIDSYLEHPTAFISNYAGECYQSKRLKDSMIILKCGIQFFNGNVEMRYNYAVVMKELLEHSLSDELKKELYQRSREEFDFILSVDPTHALALYQSAYYDLNEGRMIKARDKFALAKSFCRDRDEIYEDIERQLASIEGLLCTNTATELIEEGKVQEAIDILEQMKPSTEIQRYQKQLLLGYSLRISGEYEEAIAELEKAFHINDRDPKLLTELGLCFMMIGDVYQSEQLYLSALDLAPNSVEILCNLAIVNQHKGDFDMAKHYIRVALELDDKDEIAIAVWDQLKRLGD